MAIDLNMIDSSELQKCKSDPGIDILFVLLTCGLYGLFWQYRQIKFFNIIFCCEKFSFVKWIFLSLLTCGFYNLYHEYQMAREMLEIQSDLGMTQSKGLPIMSVVFTLISFGIVTCALEQYEMNKIIEKKVNHV